MRAGLRTKRLLPGSSLLHYKYNICSFNSFLHQSIDPPMKARKIQILFILGALVFTLPACSLFGPKYGCPSNGKNVGAEKMVSGEKTPKAKKFRS